MAVFVLVSASCSPGGPSGIPQPLTIGSTHHEADTLIYVADDQGFFAAHGLDVTIKDYSSGMAAVTGMLKGEVDIATGSEFTIVRNAFQRQAVRTIGVIGENWGVFLVGRTDRGIRRVADLEGKTVGVPVGTLAEFQFGRFLDLKGMHGKPMDVVSIDIARSVDVLVNGDVDAVQTWEPYVSRIKEKLGDGVVVWSSQSEQPQYKNVTVTDAWLARHADMARHLLEALAEADDFTRLHPAQTKAIVQELLQYDDEYVAAVWPLNKFSLYLDQALVLAMEDEARWLISDRLTSETQVPDFRNYVYLDALRAVRPEALSIR